MANPTTAFGWVMPNSADLVTDLPADFAVFGQGVDTSMQYLLGGTTGQVLSKTSGTNMAFTWINNDTGDITGVTAGTGISGGGTSGTVTITNSMATEITAKGDLIAGTGSAIFDNLPVGTNGQTLVADSTASTGLKWETVAAASGGLTLVTTSTFSAVSSININSVFTTTYTNYQIIVSCSGSAATDMNMRMRASGTDNTANNYTWGLQGMQFAGASQYNVSSGGTALVSLFNIGALGTVTRNHFVYDILNPQATDYTTYTGSNIYQNTSVNGIMTQGQGVLSVTTAYDGITLYPATGTITGSYWIYGYKKA